MADRDAGGQKPKGKGSDASSEGVGYCRPPREHQFTPGKSGNPKGSGRRKLTLMDEIERVLAMPVTTVENGKVRKIPTLRAIALKMRQGALKDDPKALKALLALAGQIVPRETPGTFNDMRAEDERLLAELRSATNDRRQEGGA